MLFNLSDFLDNWDHLVDQPPTYWYEGICPKTNQLLRLPRTPLVEAIADQLIQQLNQINEPFYRGKMYGILLVKTPLGDLKVLKAFSGLAIDKLNLDEWIPPISGKAQVILEEKRTVANLDELKDKITQLQALSDREKLIQLQQKFEEELQSLKNQHRQGKLIRQQKREYFQETLSGSALKLAIDQLNDQSYQDTKELKKFKDQWKEILQPFQEIVTAADHKIHQYKQRRKFLSRQLQSQLFQAYSITNFGGESRSLDSFMTEGAFPTGTGECCAPKLLHYAAIHLLTPVAMAEFWWGKDTYDKTSGQFYGACEERCQPLMGFLLSGLNLTENPSYVEDIKIEILYEDSVLIAVNKPAGLLSVPGRYFDKQDSILSRLRHLYEDGLSFRAIHRLDQDTSGILLIARNGMIQNLLSQQFRRRKINKVYEALLEGILSQDQGIIKLPLWGDPYHRPYQSVNWEKDKGKSSVTRFKVINREEKYTRIEFIPLTGRTHQLRVHASHSEGLGIPILGDRLYGSSSYFRLCLHARELSFIHPETQDKMSLKANTPF